MVVFDLGGWGGVLGEEMVSEWGNNELGCGNGKRYFSRRMWFYWEIMKVVGEWNKILEGESRRESILV